jgi:glycosyltransferase involved in cell wall biosynthesis
MKIAFWHFYTFRLFRGIETLTLSLANALVRKGVEASIITAKPTIHALIQPDPRVRVHAYPTSRYYSCVSIVPFYVSHFLRHRYDHIVVFFADFGEGLTWLLLNKLRDLPLSLYLCYPYSTVPHRYRSFLRLGWERHAQHILADASWIAQEAEQLFRRSVAIVPVGTDPVRFRADQTMRQELRRQWGFADDEVVMLNVSALEPRKGVWRSVQAMGRLCDRFPQLRSFILGKGDDEPNLRAMVQAAHIGDRVIFGGVTSQLEAYYNMADIFVMLPDAEANSIAVHEAMSCQLPVVVSNTGGFTESVPARAGFQVNPNSPQDIDAALAQLVTQGPLRREIGQAGRAHILAHHTWDQAAGQFLERLAAGETERRS